MNILHKMNKFNTKIYKLANCIIFMDKIQLKTEQLRKTCFGTKEYSKNSGICKRCSIKDSCKKINEKREM